MVDWVSQWMATDLITEHGSFPMNSSSQQPPISVIHCFRSPVGGLFRHVCDLVRGQSAQGLAVGIVCDSSTGDIQANKVLAELEPLCSLGIQRIPMSRTLSDLDRRAIKKIAAFCRSTKPNLIHGHGAKGGAYARLLAKASSGMKAVYTPHGGSLHYDATSVAGVLYLGLERLLKKRTHGLIFESQFGADVYQAKLGKFPCAHRVIHNGLQEREFGLWSAEHADFDFVFVGELRLLKGIDVLLQALASIHCQRPVTALIVGAGPDEAYFRQQVAALQLEAVVTFSGPIFPATDAFNRGRCVVMPSLAESFPYIVLEALAAGAPLIATEVGGIPEIFGQHRGALVTAGDVLALAEVMNEALEQPEQLMSRSVQLQQQVAERFSVNGMLQQIKTYYQQLLTESDQEK